MKRYILFSLAFFITLNVVYATTDKSKTSNVKKKPEKVEIKKIKLKEKSLDLTEGDNIHLLKYEITPERYSSDGVNWKSLSNNKIVKVSEKGELKPVQNGLDTIIVTINGGIFSDTCYVKITVDSLKYYKNEYDSIYSELKVKEKIIEDKNIFQKYITFTFITLSIALILILIQSNKRKNKISELKKANNELKKVNSELNNSIWNSNNNHLPEIEKLRSDNQKLRNTILKFQKNDNDYFEQNSQPSKNYEFREDTTSKLKQILYADAIIEGKFNRVKEQPAEDSIFELRLDKVGDIRAEIVLYEGAYQLITKRPEFLEGCEKHVIGNTKVTIIREGIAIMDNNGKWIVNTPPEIKIS